MTAALILITCSLSGSDCRPHVQAEGMGLSECMVQSQRAAAQYAIEHPKRRISRVICTDHRRVGFYIGRGQA